MVIFNRVAHQWGAFNYNPEFDVLRVPVKPQSAEHTEWLNYSIVPAGERTAHMELRWERLKLLLKFEEVH